jgi:hypothetical protein
MSPPRDADQRCQHSGGHIDLIVRIALGRRELAGELITSGHPTQPFHGWLDLVSTLDRALDALESAATDDVRTPPDA